MRTEDDYYVLDVLVGKDKWSHHHYIYLSDMFYDAFQEAYDDDGLRQFIFMDTETGKMYVGLIREVPDDTSGDVPF